MKILFVTCEANPLAKVGGLADVASSLPKALNKMGHDVRLIMPKYGCINLNPYSTDTVIDKFEIELMGKKETFSLEVARKEDGFPIYLINSDEYFGGLEIYGKNDLQRFFFFSRAVSEILPELDWQPDVVHCHDWHTALTIMWLKKAHRNYALVFTIHNLAYQGIFDENFMVESGLKKDWANSPSDAPNPPYNFMGQGILWADLVTTVSETYAKEIVTPDNGVWLDPLLRYRQKDLMGIVNGIDYDEYNPSTDPNINTGYNPSTLEKRLSNKLALQKLINLPQNPDIPMVGMIQRLEEQKGLDILEKAIDPILKETGLQMVILGRGREQYEKMLNEIAARYTKQVALFVSFNNPLAHLIYAGCDMFLMPSRFEPCGLGQLIAMRYGALPVVRHTGGLIDTVTELSPDLSQGSGFVFRDYSSEALINVVRKSVDAFKNKTAWYQVMQRVMKQDFSWEASALKYEAAYHRALRAKR
ncbi:MAG: glycogen/starch synthase [Chloroflexota bacterium]